MFKKTIQIFIAILLIPIGVYTLPFWLALFTFDEEYDNTWMWLGVVATVPWTLFAIFVTIWFCN